MSAPAQMHSKVMFSDLQIDVLVLFQVSLQVNDAYLDKLMWAGITLFSV